MVVRTSESEATRETDFDTFYRNGFKPLIWFAVRRGATLAEAEDVAQEAMKATWARWAEIKTPQAYARRIVLRQLNRIREEARREQDATRRAGEPSGPAPEELFGVEARRVLEMLRTLPDAQREVFALAMDGYGPAEIAQITGELPATVRSNLRHARRKLSRLFDQRFPDRSGKEATHGP